MIRFVFLLQFALLVGTTCSARADYIVDTGLGTSAGAGGLGVGDFNFVFHRFELTAKTHVTGIGGYFENLEDDPLNVFGVVVALTDENDFPDSIDLSTPDVLGTTTLWLPGGEALSIKALSLSLNAGWYAVGFGTGKFGAQSVSDEFPPLLMPNHLIDQAPDQFPITAIQVGHPMGVPPGFELQGATPRFVVEASAVPEPASTLGILAAVVGTGWSARKRIKRHSNKA